MKSLVWQNPDYADKIDLPLRDIDRANLVILMISYGCTPIKVEGDERQIVIWFLTEETERYENNYLANKDMVIPLSRLVYAMEWWSNMLTIWHSRQRADKTL